MTAGAAAAVTLGEYAVECAINKVIATEALDLVADQAVQIHGGNGFMDDYEVSRIYRDARINRIFEGTNEINRLLVVTWIMRQIDRGEPRPVASMSGPISRWPVGTGAMGRHASLGCRRSILMFPGSESGTMFQTNRKLLHG